MGIEQIYYLIAGALAGTLAGMLGVGGGIIVVPILIYLYSKHFPADLVAHMAVGTSLAIMIFTALSSAYAYQRRGLIVWQLFYKFTPGLIIGVITGSIVGRLISSESLSIAFGIFMMLVAINMFFAGKPKAHRDFPGRLAMGVIGACVGTCSGFFGIGGGTMIVPFFTYCNLEMRKATGTSSLCGFPIALIGAVSLIITGWNVAIDHHMPFGTTGYVYWPAALMIAITTILFAPLGTRLAVWLPGKILKRIFAVVLFFTAINLLSH